MKNLCVSFFIATGSHLIYSTVYAILVFIFGIGKDVYGKSVGFYFLSLCVSIFSIVAVRNSTYMGRQVIIFR